MISCKDLVKKLSSDESLPIVKRLEIHLHLILCKHCRVYVKHLEVLKVSFRRVIGKLEKNIESTSKKIEDEAIEKLIKKKD